MPQEFHYPPFNRNWRQDYGDYPRSFAFNALATELERDFDRENAEKLTLFSKEEANPELLVLVGIPGSGKSEAAKLVSEEFGFIRVESLRIMVSLMKAESEWLKSLPDEGMSLTSSEIFPSSLVTYFFIDRLVARYLRLKCKVVVDLNARDQGTRSFHKSAAGKYKALYRIICFSMKDPIMARNRKISQALSSKKLSEIEDFSRNIRLRPDSDEAAFARAYPDWQSKTYLEFSDGRWERWHTETDCPDKFEADDVLNLEGENALSENLEKIRSWMAPRMFN